jgi:cytochrome c oxidase subunit 3
MTGLHAFHVIVGAIILVIAIVQISKGKIRPDKFVFLENGGLYWHLVDLIWIFLFPLFYLIH